MNVEIPQVIFRLSFALLLFSLAVVNAKPPNFAENAPVFGNQDQELPVNNLMEAGLKPWQVEMLAQRLAEYSQFIPANNFNRQEYNGYDRALRSGSESKRQSRYKLCYFNPVSCFKK